MCNRFFETDVMYLIVRKFTFTVQPVFVWSWETDFKLDNTWEEDAIFLKIRSPPSDDYKFEDNNCIILKLTYLNVQPDWF